MNDSSSGRSPAYYLPNATVALVILCHVHPNVFICLSFNEVVVVSRRTSTDDLASIRELHVNVVVARGEAFCDYRWVANDYYMKRCNFELSVVFDMMHNEETTNYQNRNI